ncbi:MAG: hypothetical protein WAO12_02945 [Venatoribacter sp.]
MDIGSTSGSSFTLAQSTISQGASQVREAAQQTVEAITDRPVEGTTSLEQTSVNLKKGELLVSVGGKLLDAAEQQAGSLINTVA